MKKTEWRRIEIAVDDIINVHKAAMNECREAIKRKCDVENTCYHWFALVESIKKNGFNPMASSSPYKVFRGLDAALPQAFTVGRREDGKYEISTMHRATALKALGIKKVQAYCMMPHEVRHTKEEYNDFLASFPKGGSHKVKINLTYGSINGRDDWENNIYKKVFGINPRYFLGKRILDACCNTGGLSFLLLQDGADIVGIDILEEAIIIARRVADFEFGYRRKDIKFIHGSVYDMDKMGLPHFDICFVNQSIYKVRPNGEEALQKICELCDESLWMYTYIDSIPNQFKDDFPGMYTPTLFELKDFLKRNGFKKLIIPANENNCTKLPGLGYKIFGEPRIEDCGRVDKIGLIATKKEYFNECLNKKDVFFFSDLMTDKEVIGTKDKMDWDMRGEYRELLNKRGFTIWEGE